MKSTFAERLKEALYKNNMSAAELCRLTNTPESVMSQYKAGKYVAKQKRLDAYSQILQVSIPWLMGEDVPMREDNNTPLPEGATPYNPVMHKIPILGYIAAGLPLYSDEHIEGYTYTELNHGGEYFALRIKGDSMTAANIPDGSLVTVRVQPQVENGEIAAVRVNNENATVKRFKKDKNIVQLIPQSYNPEHQIQIYDLKKDKIDIVGKVVECKVEF